MHNSCRGIVSVDFSRPWLYVVFCLCCPWSRADLRGATGVGQDKETCRYSWNSLDLPSGFRSRWRQPDKAGLEQVSVAGSYRSS